MKCPYYNCRRICQVLATAIYLCIVVNTQLQAQDFLVLKPILNRLQVNDSLPLQIDLFHTGNSNKHQSVIQLKRYAPDGFDYNIQGSFDSVRSLPQSISAGIATEGTQVLILHTKSLSEPILQDSLKRLADLYQPGASIPLTDASVSIQQNVKLLVQAGKRYSGNCISPTTLPFEIIPENHLFADGNKSFKATFKLIFKGQPAENATIILWHKSLNTQNFIPTSYPAGKNGKVKASIERSGDYIITAVKIVPGTVATGTVQLYYSVTSWSY